MRKARKKHVNRMIAAIASLALVVGLMPIPAFAVADKAGTGDSGASTALVAGGSELEGQAATRLRSTGGLGLDPLEVAIAKSLITGAAYGLAQMGASWSGNSFLEWVLGPNADPSTAAKLDEILQKLDEIEQSIHALSDKVTKVQLQSVLNDLQFLLNDSRPEMLYSALSRIDQDLADGKLTPNEAADARLTALTDGLGAQGRYENADLPYDEFTDKMWIAMMKRHDVTLGDQPAKLPLLQVHYELLRRTTYWEHQSYEDWASFQGKAVSVLMSTLVLDKKSLEARIQRLNDAGRQADAYDVQARLDIINNRIRQCVGSSTGFGDKTNVPGLFSEDTWAAQYWMFKERPDYRYYWVPGHEVLFYAKVNGQDVPQERAVSGLNDPRYLKGIDVEWSGSGGYAFATYSVSIKYDFWKPFLHYTADKHDAPLASVDQLKTIYKDYGSSTHLYNIFIDEDQGNFQGLDEKGMSTWWFVVDGEDSGNIGYDKHTFGPDVLWCRVLTSAHASKESAILCKYHQAGSEPNKYRHYIGVGVARSGPETYDPDVVGGDPTMFGPPSPKATTRVTDDSTIVPTSGGNLVFRYDKASQGDITKVKLDGKKLAPKYYAVKGSKVIIKKACASKLEFKKHVLVIEAEKGSHTATFGLNKTQSVFMSTAYGAKPFNLNAKAKNSLTYVSNNEKVVTVNSKGKVAIRGAGVAKVYVQAADANKHVRTIAVVKVKVSKAKNTMVVSNKAAVLKLDQLKKANQIISAPKVKKAKGKLSYSITKAVKGKKGCTKKFSIDKSTGKITVKKGLPKGTYKLAVKVKATGNKNYKLCSKNAVVTVMVK